MVLHTCICICVLSCYQEKREDELLKEKRSQAREVCIIGAVDMCVQYYWCSL